MIDARALCVALWSLLCISFVGWYWAGYSPYLTAVAALLMLAPLPGLIGARRPTFVWAGLFVLPYFAFASMELLVSARARMVASCALVLCAAWLFASTVFLRRSRISR